MKGTELNWSTINRKGVSLSFIVAKEDINESVKLVETLADKELSVEIKPYKEKRSLDANAYAWVLIDKIAEVTGIMKVAVYRETIKNIGGVSEIVCVKNEAVERLQQGWSRNGLGWQANVLGYSKKNQGCTNVVLYYGSSSYDTAQMSRLIDLLVQEAKELDIPTETPAEINKLLSLWESDNAKVSKN